MQPDMGVVVHHPEALLDQMTLERRVLAEIRDKLLQHVGIEDRALDVLRAGIFAALELQDLEALARQRQGGGVAGHAGADDDRIESFFDHAYAPLARDPVARMRRQSCARTLRSAPAEAGSRR